MRQVPANIGAGEGNRTLVFSLEGFYQLNTINVYSNPALQIAPLNANSFFPRVRMARDRVLLYPKAAE